MTARRRSPSQLELVTLKTQSERDRLAMVMMQLDMALALAREKGLVDVQNQLENALKEARTVYNSHLN